MILDIVEVYPNRSILRQEFLDVKKPVAHHGEPDGVLEVVFIAGEGLSRVERRICVGSGMDTTRSRANSEKMAHYQAKTRLSQSGRVVFLPGTRAALRFTIGQRSFIHTVGDAVVSECWRVLAGTPNKGLHGGLPAIFESLPQHARGRGM